MEDVDESKDATEPCSSCTEAECDSVSFVALGDWGEDSYEAMSEVASNILVASSCGSHTRKSVRCVLALGDNFYPDGIASTRDQRVGCWRALLTPTPDSLPWYLIPGNHDYYALTGIQAQLDLSTSKSQNPFNKWTMGSPLLTLPDDESCTCASSMDASLTTEIPPAPPLPKKSHRPPPLHLRVKPARCPVHRPDRLPWAIHTFPIGNSTNSTVDMFMLDTCAVQWSVRSRHPHVLSDVWPQQVVWFRAALAASNATWKVVIGHHPLFTCGTGHQDEARCLRGNEYTTINDPFTVREGMGLLSLLHEGQADVYVSGHEHVYQTAEDVCPASGHTLHTICAGNAVETTFYRGRYVAASAEEEGNVAVSRLGELLSHRTGADHSDITPEYVARLCAGDELALDPHRSIYSRQTHAVDHEGIRGVLRIDITSTNFVAHLIQPDGNCASSYRVAKSGSS